VSCSGSVSEASGQVAGIERHQSSRTHVADCLTNGVVPTARSVYDVRVVEIRSLRATVRSWLVGGAGYLLGDTDLLLPRVRIEIVAVATGEPLSEWRLGATEATDFKAKIERDLDEKDAEAFAAEWGLLSN
jgi:hypothetical protein